MVDEQMESQELFEHFRFEVDKGQGLLRIDKFLDHKIEGISRTRIQHAARAGNILVNSVSVKPNYRVKPLDSISIVLPHPPNELVIIAEDIPLDIVYEDNDLVIINKSPDLVVHPGHGNYTGTLVNALTFHLQDLPLFKTGEVRPGLVHRLDKGTSGLMVVAKTEYALMHLARQFYERTTQRVYNALVWGRFDPSEGTITGHIGRSIRDRMRMQVFQDASAGKHAITHYRVLEELGYVSLVECRLETGRTHQIRVHMEYIGHPLFNDERYGGNKILRGVTFSKYRQFVENGFKLCPRPALHARTLGFVHPGTGKQMHFSSPLPPDLHQLVDNWRRYLAGRGEVEEA